MIAATLVLLVLFVLWRWRRGRRAGILAGRNADKPTYSIEPPTRGQVRACKDVL